MHDLMVAAVILQIPQNSNFENNLTTYTWKICERERESWAKCVWHTRRNQRDMTWLLILSTCKMRSASHLYPDPSLLWNHFMLAPNALMSDRHLLGLVKLKSGWVSSESTCVYVRVRVSIGCVLMAVVCVCVCEDAVYVCLCMYVCLLLCIYVSM